MESPTTRPQIWLILACGRNDPDFNEIYQQELAAFNERVLTDDFAERYGNLGNTTELTAFMASRKWWDFLDQISQLGYD